MVLDILTITVLIALTVLAGVVVVILGTLPGKIATRRHHPQAEAINVASWLSIITVGLWPFVLIWAYIRPGEPSAVATSEQLASLGSRIEALEEQVRRIGPSGGTP
jgi:hypothetical protein